MRQNPVKMPPFLERLLPDHGYNFAASLTSDSLLQKNHRLLRAVYPLRNPVMAASPSNPVEPVFWLVPFKKRGGFPQSETLFS